ncbi:hypothetical protein ACPWSR_09385 [Alloiococcus sp. CFN-8]|uniref:hypothetical protein n=1 Tax=Alloiococcus sp. CFN-8 TaxID=3416081 RepID=UPI003CE6E35D
MARKNTRNSKLLFNSKDITSPKVYAFLVKLVNDDREDLAEKALKIDYLLNYAQSCLKQKDKMEARSALDNALTRMNELTSQGYEPEHLKYIYDGIVKKL